MKMIVRIAFWCWIAAMAIWFVAASPLLSRASAGERMKTATVDGVAVWWNPEKKSYFEDETKEPAQVAVMNSGELKLIRTAKAVELAPWGQLLDNRDPPILALENRPAPRPPDPKDEVELSETESGMLVQLNNFRGRCGLAPLRVTANLMARARNMASLMHRRGSMLPHSSGIQENIAAGQRSPQEVTNVWINSGGHNANMRTGAKEVGLANVGGMWVQQFATGSDKWGEPKAESTYSPPTNQIAGNYNYGRRGFFGRRR